MKQHRYSKIHFGTCCTRAIGEPKKNFGKIFLKILFQSPENVPHTLSGVSCCAGKSRPWRIQTSKLDHLGLIFIARFEVAGEQMIQNFFWRVLSHAFTAKLLTFNINATDPNGISVSNLLVATSSEHLRFPGQNRAPIWHNIFFVSAK